MTLVYLALILATGFVLSRFVIPRRRTLRVDRAARTRGVIQDIQARAEYALFLVPVAGEVGLSRLGGVPDMVSDAEWPVGPEGPLGFLGQIDLAAARQAGGPEWLPDAGALQFFHDDRWGEADQVRVLLLNTKEALRRTPPDDVPDYWRYHELPIGFQSVPSLPSLNWLELDAQELEPAGAAWAELAELAGTQPTIEALHQLGGYPEEIQPECLPRSAELVPRKGLRRATSPWRLLLQIDSDDRTGMAWQDGGRLYVLIREADARAGDFSQTVTILHSY